MSQRFRRNIAPVLGALSLVAIAVGVWFAIGVHRTTALTGSLRETLAPGAEAWRLPLPGEGFVVFRFLAGNAPCATLTLLPDAAALRARGEVIATLPRERAAELLQPLRGVVTDCDALQVRAHASRTPYHGRFTATLEDGRLRRVSEPEFGQ